MPTMRTRRASGCRIAKGIGQPSRKTSQHGASFAFYPSVRRSSLDLRVRVGVVNPAQGNPVGAMGVLPLAILAVLWVAQSHRPVSPRAEPDASLTPCRRRSRRRMTRRNTFRFSERTSALPPTAMVSCLASGPYSAALRSRVLCGCRPLALRRDSRDTSCHLRINAHWSNTGCGVLRLKRRAMHKVSIRESPVADCLLPFFVAVLPLICRR